MAGKNESLVVFGFLIMWVIPFIFIKKDGRKKIGIKKPTSWFWILLSFLLGIISAGIIYVTGYFLYGTGTENWAQTNQVGEETLIV